MLSIFMALSYTCLFDFLGLRFCGSKATFARALYFFAGQLVLGWLILIISWTGLAFPWLFQILNGLVLFWFLFRHLPKLTFQERVKNIKYYYNTFVTSQFQKISFWSLILVLVAWSVISISTPTDADSLDYHLGVPLTILNNHSLIFDPAHLHFRMFGFGEMLNVFGLANGSPQWSSTLQWIGFLWLLRLICEFFKGYDKIKICLVMLGLPVLLNLIPSQKNLLNGICCTSVCFLIYFFYAKYFNKKIFQVWILALCFALGLKYSFLISGFILSIYALFKNREWLKWHSIFFIFIALFPLFLFKYINFHDAFSPLFEFQKANPDEIILRFSAFLKNYSDSYFQFPLSIILPSSFGTISTILGISTMGFILGLTLLKKYKFEFIAIFMLCFLILLLGQKTSRFFLEPLFWLLPIVFFELKNHPQKKLLFNLFSVQFYLLLPFVLVAFFVLGRGLWSNAYREKLMSETASYYRESVWINEFLPQKANIATDIRSRSLLKMNSIPFEYIFFYQPKDSTKMQQLLYEKYKIDYLVLSDEMNNLEFKKHFAGKIIAGPKTFETATRNPFNKKTYQVCIYALRMH